MMVTITPHSCCSHACCVCSACANHWPTMPNPRRERRSCFMWVLSPCWLHFTKLQRCFPPHLSPEREIPLSCHNRGTCTTSPACREVSRCDSLVTRLKQQEGRDLLIYGHCL